MVEMKLQIEGMDKLVAGLKRSPEITIDEVGKAIRRSVGLLQNQAMREAPVNKNTGGGNLRQSIKSSMTSKISGKVEVDANYALFVEEGTRPHEIRVKNKKVLANRRQGKFFGPVVHHPGTKPNPFLERSMREVTPRVNDFIKMAIENVFKLIT